MVKVVNKQSNPRGKTERKKGRWAHQDGRKEDRKEGKKRWEREIKGIRARYGFIFGPVQAKNIPMEAELCRI